MKEKTIHIDFETWKNLSMLRINMNVKTMNDVIKCLVTLKHKQIKKEVEKNEENNNEIVQTQDIGLE